MRPSLVNLGAFMKKSKKDREFLLKKHGFKYTRFYTDAGYRCFYCGIHAECLDHSPALTEMEHIQPEAIKKHEIPLALIPSCNQCNVILSNRRFHYPEERLAYLESYYQAYYEKRQALWTEEEIAELGFSLRDTVRHKQEKLGVYIEKIRHIQQRLLRPESWPQWTDNSKTN